MQAWQDDKRERLGDVEIPHSLTVKRPNDVADVQKHLDTVARRHNANKTAHKEQEAGSPKKRSPAASADKKITEDEKKLNDVTNKLEKLKAAIPLHEHKLKGVKLATEEPSNLAPHVKDIADLGVEIRKLHGDIDAIETGMSNTQFHIDELRKAQEKEVTQEAFNRMDELRKAGHAKEIKHEGEKEA